MILKAEALSPENKYPVARKNKSGGHIVIFSDERRGMVVFSNGDSKYRVGYQAADWDSCEDSEYWIPLELTIVG
jgi:hypothetical protein